jgi:hypothetical protein
MHRTKLTPSIKKKLPANHEQCLREDCATHTLNPRASESSSSRINGGRLVIGRDEDLRSESTVAIDSASRAHGQMSDNVWICSVPPSKTARSPAVASRKTRFGCAELERVVTPAYPRMGE